MMSCDLIEYRVPSGVGGTIGLFGFSLATDDGQCVPFSETSENDRAFLPARMGTLAALVLAIVLMCMNMIHYSICAVPQKEVLFYVIGALQQLSLALIQVLPWNALCETYQCSVSMGHSWIGLAHIMYLASTCINLFIDEPIHIKQKRRRQIGVPKQESFSITSPMTCQSSSRSMY
jgi:hypothetical protein